MRKPFCASPMSDLEADHCGSFGPKLTTPSIVRSNSVSSRWIAQNVCLAKWNALVEITASCAVGMESRRIFFAKRTQSVVSRIRFSGNGQAKSVLGGALGSCAQYSLKDEACPRQRREASVRPRGHALGLLSFTGRTVSVPGEFSADKTGSGVDPHVCRHRRARDRSDLYGSSRGPGHSCAAPARGRRVRSRL